MRDFVGNELAIGDEVVYCRSRKNGMDMIKAKVIGFTDKMVKIDHRNSWTGKDYSIAAPGNCVIYKTKE